MRLKIKIREHYVHYSMENGIYYVTLIQAVFFPVEHLLKFKKTRDFFKKVRFPVRHYITKPFQEEEVLARVKTHLELKRAHDEIAAQKRKLEEQNQELIEAGRLREDVERITRHDLKTPLNPIVGFSQLIMRNKHLTDKERKYLEMIKAAGHRMLLMINSSLDLLKIEQGMYQFKPDRLDILEMFKKIAVEMQQTIRNRGVALEVFLNGYPVCDKDTFFVLGEELLCYSMLANLIKNAMEASSGEEPVAVNFEESDAAVIRIHNSGVVPENIRDRFFEKYVTSRKDKVGTGLGTYSAKLMAEIQHGIISMTSSKQEGTTITIRLLSGRNTQISGDAP